jgi:preprotein translocase subunit SecD
MQDGRGYVGTTVVVTIARFIGAALVVALLVPLFPVARAGAATASPGLTVVLHTSGKTTKNAVKATVSALKLRLLRLNYDKGTVSAHGKSFTVHLPGVTDRSIVTAITTPPDLRLRPVLAVVPPSSSSGTTDPGAALAAVRSCDPTAVQAVIVVPTTSVTDDDAQSCVVFGLATDPSERLLLGPATITDRDVQKASALAQQGVGNVVVLTLTADGLTRLNALAAQLFGHAPPANEVAIVFEGEVVSNPALQTANFTGPIQISGGSGAGFSKTDASDLASIASIDGWPLALTVASVKVG